jgi:hypothetical protein
MLQDEKCTRTLLNSRIVSVQFLFFFWSVHTRPPKSAR